MKLQVNFLTGPKLITKSSANTFPETESLCVTAFVEEIIALIYICEASIMQGSWRDYRMTGSNGCLFYHQRNGLETHAKTAQHPSDTLYLEPVTSH